MDVIDWVVGGRKRWPENWRAYLRIVVVCFIIVGFSALVPVNDGIGDNLQNIHYLLASVAQGLATVFVFVVTVHMLLISSLSKTADLVTVLQDELKGPQIIFYALFVCTIMFCLWLLFSDRYFPYHIRICLGGAAICLYGVIESGCAYKRRLTHVINKRSKK